MINTPLDKSPHASPLSDAALAAQQTLLRLADEAGQHGLQGLQDACYLLEEAANGLHWSATALGSLQAWPSLVDAYRERGKAAVNDLIGFLRLPRWNLPLAEQELVLLENMLLEEAQQAISGEPPPPVAESAAAAPSHADAAAPEALPSSQPAEAPEPSPVSEAEQLEAQLVALAGQAEASGYHALQDACLLLLEALHERGSIPPFLAQLKAWPSLVENYRQQGRDAIPDLLGFLGQPVLALPLSKDDFETIGDLLHQEAERAAIGLDDEDVVASPSAEIRAERLEAHPRKVRELLELLLMQTDVIATCLTEAAAGAHATQPHPFDELQEQVERFANATHSAGFPGLSQLARHISANIQAFESHGPRLNPTRQRLLQTWLARTQWYLLSYLDSLAMHQLLASALGGEWLIPLSVDVAADILKQFQVLDESRNQGKGEDANRPRTAKPEDVSLALPNDVNRDLLGPLLQELPGQTRHLSICVQKLKSGCEQSDLDTAQRIAHTLKGSANTVGIRGVAVLTHRMEDILLACAKEHRPPGKALADTLMDASDCLEAMSDALLGLGEAPEEALAVLQRVMDWANLIDELGLNDAEQVRSAGATPASAPVSATASAPTPVARPASAPAPVESKPAEPEAAAQAAGGLRMSTELVDNLFLLSGESIIVNGQAQERLRRVRGHLQSMQAQFELLRTLGAELDTLIDLKDLSGQGFGSRNKRDFDALEMDQYNELHTASRRMVEAAVDAREFSLDAGNELNTLEELLDVQQSLAVDSQNALSQSKLAPVSSILPRLQRSMRQTCRLTGKEAELTLGGGHLLIDGDTLNALIAPLMHLLRNAVDHGIESDSERQAVGKPAAGKVAFEFESQGNDILVRCRDDGRGLDLGAVRAAAERRGLVQPGQIVSADELERFILRPNFSSRIESTQTSGRGVGLDAVYSQIRAMGGMLNLHSQPGEGMTVELRVPLPLSRSHALLVQVGQYRVVITHKGIGQIFYSGVGELLDAGGEPRLRLEGSFYPVVRLSELLRVHGLRQETRPHGAILLVQTEKQPTAVLLDAVVASRDVVIKPLGPYLAKLPGIMGATILGDGTVTPVLDLPDLLRAPHRVADATEWMPEPVEEVSEAPLVLVVDDSLSNRRALEQLLQDAGFRVRTAYDGMEAVELINQIKPAIVLTDLEMPRMNGIELASHLRTRPAGKDLPIIMITSRTTQRHRDLAQEVGINSYFTKPVREDDLLDKIHDLLREVA